MSTHPHPEEAKIIGVDREPEWIEGIKPPVSKKSLPLVFNKTK